MFVVITSWHDLKFHWVGSEKDWILLDILKFGVSLLTHFFFLRWKECSHKNQLRYSESIKILKEMKELYDHWLAHSSAQNGHWKQPWCTSHCIRRLPSSPSESQDSINVNVNLKQTICSILCRQLCPEECKKVCIIFCMNPFCCYEK